MRSIIFDLESVPRPEKELLELMPPELLNPIMPEELRAFVPPDMSKCPAYGGDEAKQNGWKATQIEKARKAHDEKREAWKLQAGEAKQKFISDAALHAPRGQVKIIGLRDVGTGITKCIVIDSTPEEQKKIGAVESWPCKVQFDFLPEANALEFFGEYVETLRSGPKIHKMIDPKGNSMIIPDSTMMNDGGKLVGYFIAGFDMPFLCRRAMILGTKIPKLMKGPRYFDDSLYTDIRECYAMGDKALHTGGLDGLALILGCKRKTGSGEGFFRVWRDDCVAAILYHLHEMDTLEECAGKVGAI